MRCSFCKTVFANVESVGSPEQNFEKLARECCRFCGSGCGGNIVFNTDYATVIHREWIESVMWAYAELASLRSRLAAAEGILKAVHDAIADVEHLVHIEKLSGNVVKEAQAKGELIALRLVEDLMNRTLPLPPGPKKEGK